MPARLADTLQASIAIPVDTARQTDALVAELAGPETSILLFMPDSVFHPDEIVYISNIQEFKPNISYRSCYL